MFMKQLEDMHKNELDLQKQIEDKDKQIQKMSNFIKNNNDAIEELCQNLSDFDNIIISYI